MYSKKVNKEPMRVKKEETWKFNGLEINEWRID